jgi:host cell factor
MSWERGKFSGLAPLSRYGHCSTSIGPHLLIFGGWEFNRASNDVIVLRDVTIGKKKNNSQSD